MTKGNKGKVNNGRRVLLGVADFFGMAGLVEINGSTTLAYQPNRVARPLTVGSTLEVEGVERTVANVAPSDYVDKMTIITLL